jgi:CRISPR-associated protein (TIGR02584 family)
VKECVLVAAPGGNPAPLVSLVWALHRHWSLRVASAHLLLYRSAERYLQAELLGGARPLEQLRAHLGDPGLAQLNLIPVRASDGSTLEDDAAPEHQARFVESLWSLVRQVQSHEPLPVLFGLVGGRRRTLAVDTTAVFQLLGRPMDRLVDLRLDPKYADDPAGGFFFPDQGSPCEVVDPRGRVFQASEVGVSLVEPRLPRLRRLLRQQDLASFAHALEAGEAALERGPLPGVVLELRPRLLRVGDLTIQLSADQMIWYATLGVARQQGGEGWVDVRAEEPLRSVMQACEGFWYRGSEYTKVYDFSPGASPERAKGLAFIRSRLRRRLGDALRGHPHRGLLVPEQRKLGGISRERLGVSPDHLQLVPPIEPPTEEP